MYLINLGTLNSLTNLACRSERVGVGCFCGVVMVQLNMLPLPRLGRPPFEAIDIAPPAGCEVFTRVPLWNPGHAVVTAVSNHV